MPELAINEYAIFPIRLFNSYIELVRILISLNPWHLNNMFEVFRQTFTFCDETFEKKSILSANKFVTLQMVDVLYVRVRTFIKQPHFTTRYYDTSS